MLKPVNSSKQSQCALTAATVLAVATLLLSVRVSDALHWKAPSYYTYTNVSETNVNAVLFDPVGTNECETSGGGALEIGLQGCPFNAEFFGVNNQQQIILAKAYDLTRYSAVIPDCIVSCRDTTGAVVFTALTIQIRGANAHSPVWSNSFPINITVSFLAPFQYLISTPATDDDADKTSDGRVSYEVTRIDGQPNSANNFIYENGGNSSKIIVFNTPTWDPGLHRIVIQAKDNPNTGTANTITNTLTINLENPAVGSSTTTSTTTKTTVTTTTATTTTTSSSTTSQLLTSAAAQVSTDTAIPTCNFITCDNNWIWILIGVGGLLLLAGGGLALGLYFRDRKRTGGSKPKSRPPSYQLTQKQANAVSPQPPGNNAVQERPTVAPIHPNSTTNTQL